MLPPRSLIALSSTAVFLFLIDRTTKALSRLLPEGGVFLIRPVIGLMPEQNVGVAFSVDLRPIPLTGLVAALMVALLVVFSRAVVRGDAKAAWALSFVVVGALGNFLDRLRYGSVTDFLVLTRWPVFNVADVVILAGAGWLIVQSFKRRSPPRPPVEES